jgi:PatG C-terminal
MADGEMSGVATSEAELTDDASMNPAASVPAPAVAAPVAPPAPLHDPVPSFVYALGQIDARFPSLSIEKEFAQATASTDNAGLTDRQTLKTAIEYPQNRYLARSLCWVLVIEGLETYILVPRDPMDLDLFVEAYRAEPRRDDLDVVIGTRTRIAPPEMCNGLALPVVVVDQLYSFDRDSLIEAIPKPDAVATKDVAKFRSAAGGLFDQLIQLADNAGATDDHRALNYLTVRYPRIYAATTELYNRNFSFSGVEVIPSRLSGVRSIVDVVFSYRHRETDVVEKQFVRVDVTEEYPFLVTKMSPFYDR